MDYFAKYQKYKLKYLGLRQEMTRGIRGGDPKKPSGNTPPDPNLLGPLVQPNQSATPQPGPAIHERPTNITNIVPTNTNYNGMELPNRIRTHDTTEEEPDPQEEGTVRSLPYTRPRQ